VKIVAGTSTSGLRLKFCHGFDGASSESAKTNTKSNHPACALVFPGLPQTRGRLPVPGLCPDRKIELRCNHLATPLPPQLFEEFFLLHGRSLPQQLKQRILQFVIVGSLACSIRSRLELVQVRRQSLRRNVHLQ
jgi:hypothetical protein